MSAKNYKSFIENLMDTVVRESGSDLHLSVGRYPSIRVDGALIPLQSAPVIAKEDTEGILGILINEKQQQFLKDEKEIDFSHNFKEKNRFRCNAFYQQGTISIIMRLIPGRIRSLKELNLPKILETFTKHKQGFFLVVGPVGQGKTTTLASMLELINTERPKHIVTIEDPIEYMFESKKATIDQREVRVDTIDFQSALRAAFRQDVDVILVGEMRGLETISTAVTAGETGHLVYSTLHTNDAAQTIDRIIDTFPGDQQGQIRLQIAASLTGIFSMRLVPRISGGLIPAHELLINNTAVANLIREARTHELQTIIETGSEHGMIDMNRSLADLVRRGEINPEDAFAYSINPQALERLL